MAKKTKRPRGLGKALRLVHQIRENMEEGKTFESLDPNAYEAIGVILGIMRGTIRGRHLSARLNAATTVLYQYRGRPIQKTEADIGGTLAELIERSMELEAKQPAGFIEGEVVDADLVEEPKDDNVPATRSKKTA
jgi:hypothetical protein